MQRIMVATDGSEPATRAVDTAADFAIAFSAALSILTVGGSLSAEDMRQLRAGEKDVWDALDAFSNNILRDAAERARRKGRVTVTTQIAWGDPAQAIIDAIRRSSPEAVVVGRRGRGQLSGLLLGSVSQKLVTLAPCVVMVVP